MRHSISNPSKGNMKRNRLILLLALAYLTILICAWRFGPMLFDLPTTPAMSAIIAGPLILCGIPCAIFCIRDYRQFQRSMTASTAIIAPPATTTSACAPSSTCPECGTPIKAPSSR